MYADAGNGFLAIPVTPAGFGAPVTLGAPFAGRSHFDRTTGWIYSDQGGVLDPVRPALLGTFLSGYLNFDQGGLHAAGLAAVAPDSAHDRVIGLALAALPPGYNVSQAVLADLDPQRFVVRGSFQVPGLLPQQPPTPAGSLCVCGADRFAYRTPTSVIIVHANSMPAIVSLTLAAQELSAGQSTTATLTMSQPAPDSGLVVSLAYENLAAAAVLGPTSVTVQPGQSQVSFTVTASTAQASARVHVSAWYGLQRATAPVVVSDAAGDPPYPANVIVTDLLADDMVWDAADRRLYASVPDTGQSPGNVLARIDPLTGVIDGYRFIGSGPDHLGVTDGGANVYTSLDATGSIARLNVATGLPDQIFTVSDPGLFGETFAQQIVPLANRQDSVAVVRGPAWRYGGNDEVAVFDNGIERPDTYAFEQFGGVVTRTTELNQLYGIESGFTGPLIDRLRVAPSGPSRISPLPGLLGSYEDALVDGDVQFDSGLLFCKTGDVADPETGKRLGAFNVPVNALVLPDLQDGKVFFIEADPFGDTSVHVFDPNTFREQVAFALPGILGVQSGAVRVGHDRIAFLTGSQVAIVNVAAPGLAGVALNAQAVVGGDSVTGSVTLTNAAPIGGALISLMSDQPGVLAVPATVTVPAGALSAMFTATTTAPATNTLVTVTGSYEGRSEHAQILVTP